MNRFEILVLRRFVPTILLCGFFLIASGCGPKGPKNVVEGKVTLKGSLVAGEVTFIGPDGKKASSPIGPDGVYHIAEPTLGENKITVTSMGGPGGIPGGMKQEQPKTKPGDKMPKMPDGSGMKTADGAIGIAPPAKYKNPDNGLKYTVKGTKKETFDIELAP